MPLRDRVVCLTAFGRFIVIDLFGLVNDKPKEFPTSMSASKEMTSARSFGRFDRLKDPMTLKNPGQSSNDSVLIFNYCGESGRIRAHFKEHKQTAKSCCS